MICGKWIRFARPLLAVLFVGFTSSQGLAQVGETFPKWSEGYLDIHHINTGKGDAAFFILPDGTTMLVDAGAMTRPPGGPRELATKPDESRTPGEWIARYIVHMFPEHLEPKLNYILLTHFDSDHMGGVQPGLDSSKSGPYLLSGVTEVGDRIPFDMIIDRAWPDYNWPRPLESANIKNYRAFVRWHVDQGKAKASRLEVGKNDQIKLVHNPEAYPEFEIRNIVANGVVWTGVGSSTRNHFPPVETLSGDLPSENMSSIGIRMSYGAFDYFTGGDLVGVPPAGAPNWQDIETPVAKAVGPVEVNVANHHGYYDAQNAFFIKTLRPKVHVLQTWVVSQPAPSTLSRLLSTRLYPGPRDIFATNVTTVGKTFIGSSADKIKSPQGHIVIRVDPGGNPFHVFVLDDNNESYRVKAVFGPYECE